MYQNRSLQSHRGQASHNTSILKGWVPSLQPLLPHELRLPEGVREAITLGWFQRDAPLTRRLLLAKELRALRPRLRRALLLADGLCFLTPS